MFLPSTFSGLRKMNPKPAMTAADLFVLLDRELRRRRPRDCDRCVMQLPYRVESVGMHAGTWDIDVPQTCGNGCSEVFEELVTEFQGLYALKGASADQRS